MITDQFAPAWTVNRTYNAILRRSVLDGLWQAGRLVRARPLPNGKWTVDVPPFPSCATVDGADLIPILHAE